MQPKSAISGQSRYFLLLLLLCVFSAAIAQKPGKKDAELLIDKTLTFLKTSDESAFIQLWHLKNEKEPEHQVPFGVSEIREHFKEMKVFLDTALSSNIKPDKIKIDKLSSVESAEFAVKYKLWARFSYSENYSKEISFYLLYSNDKWGYRHAPDYTVMHSN